jgi:hypothetical protein
LQEKAGRQEKNKDKAREAPERGGDAKIGKKKAAS